MNNQFEYKTAMDSLHYTPEQTAHMKVPDSGHEERMLACSESWTLDGHCLLYTSRCV